MADFKPWSLAVAEATTAADPGEQGVKSFDPNADFVKTTGLLVYPYPQGPSSFFVHAVGRPFNGPGHAWQPSPPLRPAGARASAWLR